MAINPISDVMLAQVPGMGGGAGTAGPRTLPTNPFDDVLSKAVDALNGISQTEYTANDMINKYIAGQAELSDVMLATSKMNIAVQLAVTVVTTAVSTFKEITAMQI